MMDTADTVTFLFTDIEGSTRLAHGRVVEAGQQFTDGRAVQSTID